MAQINFNSEKVVPMGSFEPLPIGNYHVEITETQMRPTSKGDGEYLLLILTVLDEDFNGRKIFDTLNINNPSEEASKIARGKLSAICRCVNVPHPKDSDELKGIPFMVKIGIKPAKGEYEAKNVVNKYLKVDGTEISKKTVTQETIASETKSEAKGTAPAKKKPWEK